MAAMRQQATVNENTTLLDIGMLGIYGLTAVYLIRGARKCLIDAGTREEAPRLVKMLREVDAFPPDLIVVTHPHFDHTQGIPLLRQEAYRQGKKIEVLASAEAIPLLADPSFNDVFDGGPYESIQDVTPIREKETIDLGGIALRIYDVPGHCQGHIAILDEKNRNIFVGDAIGNKQGNGILLPPFMPPTWDPVAFLSSVNKLKRIDYETLCLAHFGCVSGSEARSILDEAVATCDRWWEFYDRAAERLSDTDYLLQMMRKEINPGIPVIRPISFRMRALFRLVIVASTISGRKTAIIDKLFYGDYLKFLAKSYRIYRRAQ